MLRGPVIIRICQAEPLNVYPTFFFFFGSRVGEFIIGPLLSDRLSANTFFFLFFFLNELRNILFVSGSKHWAARCSRHLSALQISTGRMWRNNGFSRGHGDNVSHDRGYIFHISRWFANRAGKKNKQTNRKKSFLFPPNASHIKVNI